MPNHKTPAPNKQTLLVYPTTRRCTKPNVSYQVAKPTQPVATPSAPANAATAPTALVVERAS